jgi:hypothetical protein
MGPHSHIVVHPKGFPLRHRRQPARCPRQTILRATQVLAHRVSKCHPLPNPGATIVGARSTKKAKKALKDAYYTKWDGDEHLTAFGKRLDDDQRALVRSDVTIADEVKLQFYLEQMYDSNHFEKSEMLDWEKKPTIIKTNYDNAKDYFKALVKATNTYAQNTCGGNAGRNKYKSATWRTLATKSVNTSQISPAHQRSAPHRSRQPTPRWRPLDKKGQESTERCVLHKMGWR